MPAREKWVAGVDLGGTNIEVALVDARGRVRRRLRRPTRTGAKSVERIIIDSIRSLLRQNPRAELAGVGLGVAGQIKAEEGIVHFSPNLGWHNVPIRADLEKALQVPVLVTNDVRAATWGEWLFGAGKGASDLICLFVGTGIGGGVVSAGRILTGGSNTAGELGHTTVDLHGPTCHCGHRGCLEAMAGGWAIARNAREAVSARPEMGREILRAARGKVRNVTAESVARAVRQGDPLAGQLIDEVVQVLIAGGVTLVNAFNPRRFILGGGVIEGLPELVDRVGEGVRRWALPLAGAAVEVVKSELGKEAGVIGAAALVHCLEKGSKT